MRWPEDEGHLEQLRAGHFPRLLLVEEDAPPPLTADPYEDWVRLPASETDVHARVETLRTRLNGSPRLEPTLDRHDVLRFGDAWVSVPPVEARLLRRLIERYGSVVSREVLTHIGWPEREPGRNALDVHVLRLRRRIEPVGLVVRTVRSRGYLLEASVPAGRY